MDTRLECQGYGAIENTEKILGASNVTVAPLRPRVNSGGNQACCISMDAR
jgi:hypothetical protein